MHPEVRRAGGRLRSGRERDRPAWQGEYSVSDTIARPMALPILGGADGLVTDAGFWPQTPVIRCLLPAGDIGHAAGACSHEGARTTSPVTSTAPGRPRRHSPPCKALRPTVCADGCSQNQLRIRMILTLLSFARAFAPIMSAVILVLGSACSAGER